MEILDHQVKEIQEISTLLSELLGKRWDSGRDLRGRARISYSRFCYDDIGHVSLLLEFGDEFLISVGEL